MKKKLLIAFVGGLAACAAQKPAPVEPTKAPEPVAQSTPPPEAKKPPPSDQPITVELRVEALTKSGSKMIESEDTLHSGDRMALQVSVDQPAYVYVALAPADGGKPQVLYPPKDAAEAQVQPGAATRIPPAGQWFRLDKDTGQEDILVYAAHEPMSAETLEKNMLTDAREFAGKKPAQPKKPKPPKKKVASSSSSTSSSGGGGDDAPGGLGSGTRGLALDTEEPAKTEGGITSLHFAIHHKK
jgi:hypothetical protein